MLTVWGWRRESIDQAKAAWKKVVESKKFEFLRMYNNVDKHGPRGMQFSVERAKKKLRQYKSS